MVQKASAKERFIMISIIVVAILLIISIVLLLSVHRHETGSSSVQVIIRPGGDVIRLKDVDAPENARMHADNMFPGDCESKTYYIEIRDSNIKAYRFKAEIASENAALSDVLAISVTVGDAEDALYSGLLKDMPANLRAWVGDDPGKNAFQVAVSLDTSVGNEYQANDIMLHFQWWVEDSDVVSGSVSGDGGQCCPWCFGVCPWCWILPLLLLIVLVIVIAVLVMWFSFRRKKIREAAKAGTALAAKDIGLAALFGSLAVGASVVIHKWMDRKDRKDR